MSDVIIIGGGPAGIGAAETLLSLGKTVTVLESAAFAGGVPLDLSCKGDVECTRCHVCMPRDSGSRMANASGLEVVPMAIIEGSSSKDGGMEFKLRISPRYVNIGKCTGCGKCAATCPVPGALVAPPHGAIPSVPYIDSEICQHFTSKKCAECAKVCPTCAIDYEEKPKAVAIHGKAVIVATGLDPIDPTGVQHYGYGYLPNVLTSLDAERIIAEHGDLRRPTDGQKPKKLAIIQCVGSRTTKGGVEYCSKFCCKYGLRIARALVERAPDAQVDFLYMDLRTFEPRTEALAWIGDRKNFTVSQGVASVIQKGANNTLMVRRTTASDVAIEEGTYDMVILSVGGQPRPETKVLAERLGLKTDSFGFVVSQDSWRGVFVAGSCKAPMDIEESFTDGKATALSVLSHLEVER
jgi:heterodisulfide reductase subunit A